MTDQARRALFYDDRMRDAVVKLLALKAAWQVRQLSRGGRRTILFIDEPGLAGFGSSEFISVSRDEIVACLQEVIAGVHQEGGLAGIHVCANTDWSIALDSDFDIVNFDAYGYFDKFILYGKQIKTFLAAGRILAWGIVPTSNPDDIERETAISLVDSLEHKIDGVEALGIARETILKQSLISPSCGTGSARPEHARKVLRLTREVSQHFCRQLHAPGH